MEERAHSRGGRHGRNGAAGSQRTTAAAQRIMGTAAFLLALENSGDGAEQGGGAARARGGEHRDRSRGPTTEPELEIGGGARAGHCSYLWGRRR